MKPASSSQANNVSPAGIAGDAGVSACGKDGADDFFGVAALTEDLCAFAGCSRSAAWSLWASVRNRNRGGGRQRPQVLISAVFACVGANACFHGEICFTE